MGSKSAQNLTIMPNLQSDYVSYKLDFRILDPPEYARGPGWGDPPGTMPHRLRPPPGCSTCATENDTFGRSDGFDTKMAPPNEPQIPPEAPMGSKSGQNLTLTPNLQSDYVG